MAQPPISASSEFWRRVRISCESWPEILNQHTGTTAFFLLFTNMCHCGKKYYISNSWEGSDCNEMQFKFSGTPVTVIGNNSPERPGCNCNQFCSFFFLFLFLLLFLSLSFSLHAQRRDEPGNWLHASRDPLNQERAINLSIKHCFVTSWEVFTCWVKLSHKLHSWWCPSVNAWFSCLTFYLRCLGSDGRTSNSTHAAYLFDGAYFQHTQRSCGTWHAHHTDSWVRSNESGPTEHTPRWKWQTVGKTDIENEHDETRDVDIWKDLNSPWAYLKMSGPHIEFWPFLGRLVFTMFLPSWILAISGPSSPLTFHNVKNHGSGGAAGEPGGIAKNEKKTTRSRKPRQKEIKQQRKTLGAGQTT